MSAPEEQPDREPEDGTAGPDEPTTQLDKPDRLEDRRDDGRFTTGRTSTSKWR